MDERRLTQKLLGQAVGVSHVTIGNYLAGKPPKSEHLLALARHFNMTMDQLTFGGEIKVTELRECSPPVNFTGRPLVLEKLRGIQSAINQLIQELEP